MLGTCDAYELIAAERQAVEAAVQGVTSNPYRDFEAFLAQARRASAALPEGLLAALDAFREQRASGAMLVRNLPLPDRLPATPSVPFAELPAEPVGTERVLATVAAAVGQPFSYREWDSGYLVHNKYPIASHREIQFGSNAVEFLLHTETPFRDVSPDFLALLCVRGDKTGQAKTRIADIARVCEGLEAASRAVLHERLFAFETDNPVHFWEGRGFTEPQAVLSERDGRAIVEYVGDLVAVSPGAQDALDVLHRRVAGAAVDIALEPGDLLLLDNARVVHGRTAYEPAYDGGDRWLQRMLLTVRLFQDGPGDTGRLVPDRRYANYPTAYQDALQSTAGPVG